MGGSRARSRLKGFWAYEMPFLTTDRVPGGLPSSYRDGGPPVGGDTILNVSDFPIVKPPARKAGGFAVSGGLTIRRAALGYPNTGTVF